MSIKFSYTKKHSYTGISATDTLTMRILCALN